MQRQKQIGYQRSGAEGGETTVPTALGFKTEAWTSRSELNPSHPHMKPHLSSPQTPWDTSLLRVLLRSIPEDEVLYTRGRITMSLPSKDLEQLKQDAERLADQLPQSTSKDEALEVAIKAAETAMQALKLAQDPSEKAKLTTRLKQLLAEAEQIKLSKDWRATIQMSSGQPSNGTSNNTMATSSKQRVLKEPHSTRELSKSDQILLLKAGFLHGFKFPPWTSPPDPEEFELKDGEELFLDTQDLPLSEFQEDVLDDWKRPADALPPPSWFPGDRTNLGPGMSFSRKIDLVQDAATDCSVVASLCAGVARLEHGHPPLLGSVLHPYDGASNKPIMSKNGKYIARLNFNGCYRKVVIDDRLPTSSTSHIVHVVDKNNPGLLWPALIEKAYLKVRGGYDFPGSNSGTDLWILSGWIPEQVFLQCDDLEPDRFWQRMFNGFNFGDVMITMGTGKMSTKTERELGLAGEHDYAVLDLREVDGQRLFLIKNPWCEGTSWRGKLKEADTAQIQTDEQSADLALIDLGESSEPLQNSRDLLNADDRLSPGTFWMDLNNVLQHFESIYLNWNPGLFAFRQDVHFSWDLSPSENGNSLTRGRYASLTRHPQYTVTAEKGGIVWVLLWRHFQNAVPADATAEEIEADRYGIDLKGHISLIAFSSRGRRVLLPDNAVEKGWFVDSPQTLLKIECQPGEVFTLVPAEQELPVTKHTFTISAFGNSPILLVEASTPYKYATTISGSWTKETAGGNAHSHRYSTNPQFSITVPQKMGISLLLESTNEELNVHVKLVYSKGQRIHSISNRDIVFDSKDYRHGCCVAECAELGAGQYTIICSTFEPDQLSDFTLLVESTDPAQVILLPREGAGRMRLELSTVGFKQGQSKVAAPLAPRRLVKLYAIARYLDEWGSTAGLQQSTLSNRSLIRLSVEIGRGPDRRILIASNSGEYSSSAGGIRTEDIDLSPEMRRRADIWVVLDRIYTSEELEERVAVELFVDQPDALSCGVWRAWDD